MSAAKDPYVPVYYSIVDDERFGAVYPDDHALAAWVRLLLVADGCYPASAPLPYGIRKASLKALTDAGLVELMGNGRYIIHGLQAEREKRSDVGRSGAEGRWSQQYGRTADALPTQYGSNGVPSDPAMLTTKLREANLSQEKLTAPETGPDVWYWVTLRYPDKRVNANLWEWLSRLCDDFGVVRLWEVMRTCYAQDHNKGTLLTRTEAVLSRETDQAERASERERLAEKRKPVVIQPKPEETAEERERRETAFAKMRENVKQIGMA